MKAARKKIASTFRFLNVLNIWRYEKNLWIADQRTTYDWNEKIAFIDKYKETFSNKSGSAAILIDFSRENSLSYMPRDSAVDAYLLHVNRNDPKGANELFEVFSKCLSDRQQIERLGNGYEIESPHRVFFRRWLYNSPAKQRKPEPKTDLRSVVLPPATPREPPTLPTPARAEKALKGSGSRTSDQHGPGSSRDRG